MDGKRKIPRTLRPIAVEFIIAEEGNATAGVPYGRQGRNTMGAYEDYCELIDCVNTRDAEPRARKQHRLAMDCYAASDCEFFFTLCARHLGERFRDDSLARAIVESLLWRRSHHRWTLYCYCLMPDHLHFLVQLAPGDVRWIDGGARGIVPEGILEHIGQFKSYTTTQIWWKLGGCYQLWARSSYVRAIRYNDSPEAVAYYALSNPVRKGLVTRWEDYPYAKIVDRGF